MAWKFNPFTSTLDYYEAGSGTGTVTSVTFTGDGTVLSSTPSSAVTTSGTVTAAIKTQNANVGLFGPASGSAASPTFRSLSSSDFPVGAINSDSIINLGLITSIGSSLLTVTAKQNDASTNASASSPIVIAFRNSTLATGSYLLRSVTGALSVNTVATGCTLGTISGVNQYIYVYAIDNAGTIELALAGGRDFDEGTRYTTTALDGFSRSSAILYSTTARSNVAIRLLGRLLVNEAVAGTYDSNATEVSLAPFGSAFPLSQVRVDTAPGTNPDEWNGTVNTTVARFTNVTTLGSAITYASSSTLGDSFTVNERGIYTMSAGCYVEFATGYGFTVNSPLLSTPVNDISYPYKIADWYMSESISIYNLVGTCICNPGDIIRVQTRGDGVSLVEYSYAIITKLSGL